MEENCKNDFLYRAISDIQATIRALDIKLGFLFIIYFSPVLGGKEILNVVSSINGNCFYLTSFIIIFCVWCFGLYSLFLALKPIYNCNLEDTNFNAKGTFYSNHLYQFNTIDLICNFPQKPKISTTEFKKSLPTKNSEIESELIYEVYKLTYIRGLKSNRVTKSIYCAFISIICTIPVWFLHALKVFI